MPVSNKTKKPKKKITQKEFIEKIVYWIYEEEVELNDPQETIKQIQSKLRKKS